MRQAEADAGERADLLTGSERERLEALHAGAGARHEGRSNSRVHSGYLLKTSTSQRMPDARCRRPSAVTNGPSSASAKAT